MSLTAMSPPDRIRRAGTIAMELLLNLPIWLITVLAMVELGLVLGSAQHVSFGARVAAEEASRTEFLATAEEVPAGVIEAARRHLAVCGMAPATIILEHNAGGRRRVLAWGEGRVGPPQNVPPTRGTYVRVTVAARLERFVPRVFRSLGLDLASQRLVDSATFRYAVERGGTE